MAVKMSATAGCALCAYLIARKKLTPTGTYMLFCWAHILLLVSQAIALFNSNAISSFLSEFDLRLVIFTQVLASVIFLLMLTAFIRKLAALKASGIK